MYAYFDKGEEGLSICLVKVGFGEKGHFVNSWCELAGREDIRTTTIRVCDAGDGWLYKHER